VTLLESVPYTWAGVSMVCKESILTTIFSFKQNHEHEASICFLPTLSWSGLLVWFAWLCNCLIHVSWGGEKLVVCRSI
jgi:hypothetical protein